MPSPDHGVSNILGKELYKQAIAEYPQYKMFIAKIYHNAYSYVLYMRRNKQIPKQALVEQEAFWEDDSVLESSPKIKEDRIDKALKKIQELSIEDDDEGEDEEDD